MDEVAMLNAIEAVLHERNISHGNFVDHAGITQALKAVIYNYCDKSNIPFAGKLTDSQRESIDMICHKIGRILAGNPNHRDHWVDIAGYSQLIVNQIVE